MPPQLGHRGDGGPDDLSFSNPLADAVFIVNVTTLWFLLTVSRAASASTTCGAGGSASSKRTIPDPHRQ
jgi:hypothetical protein